MFDFNIRLLISCLALLCCPFVAQSHNVAPLGVSDLSFSVDKDASVRLSFRFNPSSYDIKKESELIIEPVVKSRDMPEVETLPVVMVAGKNRELRYRRGLKSLADGAVLYSAGESNPVNYDVTVPYEKWMDNCTLSLNISVKGCCGKKQKDITVPVAEVCFQEASFVAPELQLNTGVKSEPKIRELQGSAYIDYRVNRTDIDPRYRKNVVELTKILSTINVVKNDPDASITDIFIKGFASPEGSYANNTRLASGRTKSLKEYVKSEYQFDDKIFHTSFEPEDWVSLRDSIATSSFADKKGMLEIIDSNRTPDEKDALLKSTYPADYKVILTEIYPGLRRSDYVVRYKIREYVGVDEIRKVLATHPKNLSADEFLMLLASYTPGSKLYDDTLSKGVSLFPEDARINYLQGVAFAEKGEYEKALPFLKAASRLGVPEADSAIESIDKMREVKDPVKYLDYSDNPGIMKK